MGKEGGEKTKKLYGLNHYKNIRAKKRRILSQEQAQKEAFPQINPV